MFTTTIDIIFWADLVKQFFTGFITVEETFEMRPQKVAWHYVCGWFVIDLCGVFPFDMIVAAATNSEAGATDSIISRGSKSLKILRLLRLAKLLRLLRISRILLLSACLYIMNT